jgi:hypothetical protein
MVDPDRATVLPHYGSVPICLEEAEVRIGARLKGMLMYNACVAGHPPGPI